MAHFRVHLAVLLILCALPLLFGALRREGLVAIAFGLAAIGTISGASFIPGLGTVHAAFAPREETQPVYRLLQMNLRFDNSQSEKVLSLVGRLRPDVITFEEVSDMWAQRIAPLSAAYPYRVDCTIDGESGGVAILSLRPFAEDKAVRCNNEATIATARFDFGGRPLEIGAIHLSWPWPFDQSMQIDDMADELASLSPNALLAGDLNATPWSETAKRIADAGGLRSIGPIGVTWLYRRLPEFLRFSGLPIDQVFAKGGVHMHSAHTLEAAGSDHLPVLVEFSLDPVVPAPDAPASNITAALAPAR